MIQTYRTPSTAAGLLQLARLKSGLSQSKLAERAGVPPTMVSAYERDLRQPSVPTLLRLLRAAGFELRMHLSSIEEHDQVLEDLEAARTHRERRVRDRQLEAWRRAVPIDDDPPRQSVTQSFYAAAILNVLNRHGVEYVVIGAFAAIAQRAPIPASRDIDLTPSASVANLSRLSAALHELDARIRVDRAPGGLRFDRDGASLGRAKVWNLICVHGEFDLSFFPSAFDRGYEQLVSRAHRVAVEGTTVVVADLEDVIRSMEAAGRPKDLQVLPILYRHLRHMDDD